MSKTKLKTALSNIDLYWAKDALEQIEKDEQTINSLREMNIELQTQVNELREDYTRLQEEKDMLIGMNAKLQEENETLRNKLSVMESKSM